MPTQEAPATEALLDGRYRLRGCIGRGGMAAVYQADDTTLERTVAVKLFRQEAESRFPAGQVRSEKALLASLSHPALVTLFDAHVDAELPHYLVMEYVDGPTLNAQLTYGALPPEAVAQIGGDLAAGLEAVHAAGVVHCDVKPSNVLLIRPDREGGSWHAKLADFGVACVVESPDTKPDVIVGTAAYMAPEQLRHIDLGPEVDVYALGLVLIEALCGRPAYPLSSSVESALVRLAAPPVVPEDLGPEWVRLLTWMTRTEPAERPTAAQVAAALRAIPVGAGPASVPTEVSDPSAAVEETLPATQVLPTASTSASGGRTSRRMLVAMLAVLLIAATGAAGLWAAATSAVPAARAVIETPFERAAPPVADVVEPDPGVGEQKPSDSVSDSKGAGPGNENRGPGNENSGPGNSEGNGGEKGNSGKGGG